MKPCPFCGHVPKDEIPPPSFNDSCLYRTSIRVICSNCHMAGPFADTVEKAKELWDLRKEDSRLNKIRKTLEDYFADQDTNVADANDWLIDIEEILNA